MTPLSRAGTGAAQAPVIYSQGSLPAHCSYWLLLQTLHGEIIIVKICLKEL